jgi:hypothetical protein
MSDAEIRAMERAEEIEGSAYAHGLSGAAIAAEYMNPDAIEAFAAGAADRAILDVIRRHGA